MRVHIFSVGIGYRLFGYSKKMGFKFGKLPSDWDSEGFTDYRLSVLPVGGYVKIAGMVDESLDDNYVTSEPKDYEFRSKNTFQKAFAISAGVIMNALLAFVIFASIALFQGKEQYYTTKVAYVQKGTVAEASGFKANDVIKTIDGLEVFTWLEIIENLAIESMGKPHSVEVLRDNQIVKLNIDGKSVIQALESQEQLGIHPSDVIVFLGMVETLRPAGKAGMQPGDTIISINGEAINTVYELIDIVKSHKEIPLFFEWKRGNKTIQDSITPSADGLIGIQPLQEFKGKIEVKNYSLFEAIGHGFSETIKSIKVFIGVLSNIFQGNLSVKKSLGGPILIAKMASQQAGLGIVNFLYFMAMLSITLAVINILPVPALDGGHLVFIIIEGIIRKEIPFKVKMAIQQFGIAILILLMGFMFYNDIARLFGN